MPQYMLLLHQDPSGFARLSPEQMQAAVEKYMAWGQKLRQAGYPPASNKLTDEPERRFLLRRLAESERKADEGG
jgi:hypothetical protein